MDSSITKSFIRKTVLSYRRLLSLDEYEKRNESLLRKLDHWMRAEAVHFVHLFLAISKHKEPDVSSLLPHLWERNVVTITSVTDFEKREMSHYHLKADTGLKSNHLGIPEPIDKVRADFSKAEAILVPLLVVDKSGGRIGYGGGFYDKLLNETKAVKIGLSLSNPVDKIQQTEKWDVSLDLLITPFKIYHYG
ncbi:MAG: 5-formyltetrahydrofolate cyclo-ligase [Ekhidna sp.]|nr:5-formyltetrahydrofolate cyclo-ligase [Ekhidna sp.]